jgi:hypothetical protein
LCFFAIAIKAQPPPPIKPLSIEERLKETNEVIQQEVKPTATQKTAIESAFKTFLNEEDK